MPHGIANPLPELHLFTNRQGAGPDDSAEAFVHRRRGDRLGLTTSAYGPKQTLPPCSAMSAFGGKADMMRTRPNVRF
jgi:hypothetical protein